MKYAKLITALGFTALMSGCVVIAAPSSRADFHIQKELTLNADGLTAMDIEAGSGSLIIQGQAGLTEIKVTADIYTSKKHTNNYELSLEKSGSTGFLVAKTLSSSGFWTGSSPHVDIVIHVPESMSLAVDDGSGEIEIKDIVGKLDVKDGSGGILIKNIVGDTSIQDGSGGIEISQINGMLNIVDGSGGIEITDVEGDLTIDDGSGTIFAKNINGNAKINDGSGDLTVKQVTGIVTLDDGSGDITVKEAGGLNIENSGSGGLNVSHVKGDFKIDS
ncbi:hypothetical protein AADZ91_02435 [Colwelliaceae bacterium 6441]